MADTLPATRRPTCPAIACAVPACNEADRLSTLLRLIDQHAVSSAAPTAQDLARVGASPRRATANV